MPLRNGAAESVGWGARARARRARRALERQLDYQRNKARRAVGREAEYVSAMREHSSSVRATLEAVRPIEGDARVLEVGSGAHGLIFFFGTTRGVGLDPLAAHYATLFPAWQRRAHTIAAHGEALPFADGSFDVVLCDNVVDHAERPDLIVSELARVLSPGGLLYFTVNVHHPVYAVAAALHAGWRAAGLPFEVGPFADHTVHLTLEGARLLFKDLPLRLISERHDIAEARARAHARAPRNVGDRFKSVFFKNALFEVVATREGDRRSWLSTHLLFGISLLPN
ncbi:MAG: class I SAM-dependent methyltransferase [Acidobacteria bacterium]|nr:class I SAM-dependent methyltransferase [Acidobacteriota bacterium]